MIGSCCGVTTVQVSVPYMSHLYSSDGAQIFYDPSSAIEEIVIKIFDSFFMYKYRLIWTFVTNPQVIIKQCHIFIYILRFNFN